MKHKCLKAREGGMRHASSYNGYRGLALLLGLCVCIPLSASADIRYWSSGRGMAGVYMQRYKPSTPAPARAQTAPSQEERARAFREADRREIADPRGSPIDG